MTSRLSLDFKNGIYTINGAAVAVSDCVIPGGNYPFSYSDIVPTVGLRVISDTAAQVSPELVYSYPILTPTARAAVIADGVNAGFTAVATFNVYVSGSNQSLLDFSIGDGIPFTQGWAFQPNWRVVDGNLSVLYDFDATQQDVTMASMGRHKAAFTLSASFLAASIDGAAVTFVAPSQATTGSIIEVGVTATTGLDGGTAITVLEKIEYFETADNDDLPDLSGGDDDGEGDGLTDLSVRLRVWGFSLDGNDYAVWRLGASETLVYNVTTNTWAEWQSPGRDNWRAHVGQNWVGMSTNTLDNGFGSDIVAGDDASGVLWILDPTSGRDDRATSGSDYFDRVVTGGLSLSGREVAPCGALQLDYSTGNPTQDDAAFTLETSDDWGNSFDSQGTVTVAAADFTGVVEWRGLGQAKAPGRVFRITDNGAATRLSGADLR